MKNTLLTTLLVCFSATAAAQEPPSLDEAALRTAFKDLKDPGSAQFRDIKYKLSKGAWAMCGEVNAKNSFGAYTGFKRFYGVVSSPSGRPQYWVGPIGDIAVKMCTEDGL